GFPPIKPALSLRKKSKHTVRSPFLIPILLAIPLALASPSPCTAATIQCPLIFDGRVPAEATPQDFDTALGSGWNPYNPDYVKGADLSWTDIILLPGPAPASTRPGSRSSRFDVAERKRPLEVTISDASVFMNQRGFRRAGLLFAEDTNEGSPAGEGVKTLHCSARLDLERPLNLTHEYLNVWHETAAYDANQFNFQTGTIISQPELPKDTYKPLDRDNKLLWSTPMAMDGSWQNFALTPLFILERLIKLRLALCEKEPPADGLPLSTIQIWHSAGNNPLARQGGVVPVDLAGDGQYQIGILKKPTGTGDVVNSGYQSSNLNEGLIYGGIFIEDSANGCVSI
ncbi:hypothetical protein CCUS01_07350, partial [Colletotrichum cuscutae]